MYFNRGKMNCSIQEIDFQKKRFEFSEQTILQ